MPLAAGRFENRVLIRRFAVLSAHLNIDVLSSGAEVDGVDQNTLLPPSRSNVNLETGASGSVVKVVRS